MIKFDGHDNAIIGVSVPWQNEHKETLVYSGYVIIDNLKNEGMTEDEAYEYLDFNIAGAYVGETTPIIVWDYVENE